MKIKEFLQQIKTKHDDDAVAPGQLHETSHASHEEHAEHEEHEEHIDERWLVSYADMMTLLFGLFVMLYSMAVEHQGGIDQQLQKMANQTFAATETPPPVQVEPKVDEPKPDPTIALRQELQQALAERDELMNLKQDAEAAKLLREQLQASVADREKIKIEMESLKRVKEELEAAQQMSLLASSDKSAREQQMIALQQQLAANQQELAQLRVKNEESERRRLEEEAKFKREIASVTPPKPQPVLQPQQKPQDQTEQLRQTERKLAEAEKKSDAMEKQIEDLEKKLEQAQKQAEQTKDQKTFLMFITKWTTDKHDVDMTVTDPAGKSFNYKARKSGGRPGEFTLDSRSGPGAEIWQAENFTPGTYKIRLNLYQDYGNEAPAAVSLTAVTSKKRINLGTVQLKVGGKREAYFNVKVNEKGEIGN